MMKVLLFDIVGDSLMAQFSRSLGQLGTRRSCLMDTRECTAWGFTYASWYLYLLHVCTAMFCVVCCCTKLSCPSRQSIHSLQHLTCNSTGLSSIEKTVVSLTVMPSQSCGLLSRQEITSLASSTSCLASGQQNWGILAVGVVEAAEEWQIGFKQLLLQIKDGEQMLRYSLELTKHGNTALRASRKHREMQYV